MVIHVKSLNNCTCHDYVCVTMCNGNEKATGTFLLIFSFAFDVSDVNRIEAFVEPPNTGSRVLLEKLGFTLEGTLR